MTADDGRSGLDNQARERITEIIRARGEPLPIEVIARRFFAEEARPGIVSYQPDRSVLVGQRVAWDTHSFGRLIGEVTSCECVHGQWRILVDWEERLSPGLKQYREHRQGVRLAYLVDPTAAIADPLPSDSSTNSTSSLAELLQHDLEDDLRRDGSFASWAGQWAPTSLLPELPELAIASEISLIDDGIAQTNQILELLRLPGPDRPGHGFAAMAVNLSIQHDSKWIWAGPRDGGEWLPRGRLQELARTIGPAPRFEDVLIQLTVPDIPDNRLPTRLAEFVGEATVDAIGPNAGLRMLVHVISAWEALAGVLAFDQAETGLLPDQARICLAQNGSSDWALYLQDELLLVPESEALRQAIASSRAVTIERMGNSDILTLGFERRDRAVSPTEPDSGPQSEALLAALANAFLDGRPHNPEELVAAVRTLYPGDRSLIARAIAALLASFECFDTVDDWNYIYHPDRPHAPRSHQRAIPLRILAARSAAATIEAARQDREFRRWRADGIRSSHMVRGHLRRIRKGEFGNPIQVALAKRHGIVVPRGHTFVRPHERRS